MERRRCAIGARGGLEVPSVERYLPGVREVTMRVLTRFGEQFIGNAPNERDLYIFEARWIHGRRLADIGREVSLSRERIRAIADHTGRYLFGRRNWDTDLNDQPLEARHERRFAMVVIYSANLRARSRTRGPLQFSEKTDAICPICVKTL